MTNIMDPQQELFTQLLLDFREAYPDSVYDGVLPPEGTPYPFIYLEESQLIDDMRTKDAVMGDIHQTIHVFIKDTNRRGTLSDIAYNLKGICRRIDTNRNFCFDLVGVDQRVLVDTSESYPLLHCVLDMQYKFYRR